MAAAPDLLPLLCATERELHETELRLAALRTLVEGAISRLTAPADPPPTAKPVTVNGR